MSLVSGNVLITGATGGIGQAIARAFGSRGANLLLTGRRTDVLEPLVAEFGARVAACDLADRGSLARLVEEAGPIDVLVANAALPGTGHITELTQSQIDAILEVNLRAPIALGRALLPAMVEQRRGHLVFVSSLSGKVASRVSSLYNATKFGLRGFALGVREDLREAHVGASVILPGFVSDAGMFADAGVKLPRGVTTRTPEQVAAAVIEAVERNRAEISVAPLSLRLGASIASVAPELASRFTRLAGGDQLATDLAAGQRHRRPQ